MALSKLDRSQAAHETPQVAPIEPWTTAVFDAEKAIGGWKVMRPEGRTVHVAKPLGSKHFKGLVTRSALTKASQALARLQQSRLG